LSDIIKGHPLSDEEKAAAEVRASAQAKAADEAKAAAEAKAADEAKASSKGARDMAYQFKQTISSILKDEQFKNYTDMVDKLFDLNNPRVDQQLSGLTGSITTDIPRTCRSIKKYYLENFPNDDKLILDLTDDSIQEVKTIVKEYFPEKNGTLQFEKDCTAGNVFKTMCTVTILSRIKDFITKIKKALNLIGLPIPKSFKLKYVESRITKESIKSAYEFLTDKQKTDEDVIAFFEMCVYEPPPPPPTPTQLDESQQEVFDSAKKKAHDNNHDTLSKKIDELVTKKKDTRLVDKVIPLMIKYINGNMEHTDLKRYLDELSQGGGSRSVCRNKRKTKKKIKNKYYKCSKKHHHRRTKRHMKRHRKTKRHMKRQRKTKRHTMRH
jgi:hypothetical protein